MESQTEKKAKPFVKWAGGKTKSIKYISKRIPFDTDDEFTYVEPFLGGGAILFWIADNFPNLKQAIVNDINKDLVDLWTTIRDNPEDLIECLKPWEKEFNAAEDKHKKKEYYYERRKMFNARDSNKLQQSALLMFLNKTGFNGLYRVNSKNEFNVPIGSYKKPTICDEKNIRAVSRCLSKTVILCGDYSETAKYSGENTFYYFDPPYRPISKTSHFNSYDAKAFNDSEQLRLKEFCDKMDSEKSKFILSNSDPKPNAEYFEDGLFFDNLYCDYSIERVDVPRFINSKSSGRGAIKELLITNYNL